MASEFDDFMREGVSGFLDITGRECFKLSGLTGDFSGDVSEFAREKEVDLGGIIGAYSATVLADLDQFEDCAGPLEEVLGGRKLTVNGRTFRVSRVAVDESGVTFGLVNLGATK